MSILGRTPKPTPTPYAEWIRDVRESIARMTQEDFAEAIGVVRTTVTNWERGEYEPSYEALRAIRKRFPSATVPAGIGPPDGARSEPQSTSSPRFTFASLHEALEKWCVEAGEPALMDDDLFVKGLLDLFQGYKSRKPKRH